MSTLTVEIILEKTKVSDLDSVRHLNLWGEQLGDVSVVKQLKNIEVLALASNKVTSLKPFSYCSNLQELYLRKNSVENIREVTNLKNLKKLHTLWLMDNPCSKHPSYRDFVLHCCPYLKQLDGAAVTKDERTQAAKKLTPKILDDILGRAGSASTAASPRPSQPRPSTGAASPPRESVKGSGSPRPSTSGPGNSMELPEGRSSSNNLVLYTTVQAQRAMLLSIVSLLPELTDGSLEMLQKEVADRLERQRGKITKITN